MDEIMLRKLSRYCSRCPVSTPRHEIGSQYCEPIGRATFTLDVPMQSERMTRTDHWMVDETIERHRCRNIRLGIPCDCPLDSMRV